MFRRPEQTLRGSDRSSVLHGVKQGRRNGGAGSAIKGPPICIFALVFFSPDTIRHYRKLKSPQPVIRPRKLVLGKFRGSSMQPPGVGGWGGGRHRSRAAPSDEQKKEVSPGPVLTANGDPAVLFR